ncbi:Ig-like domain-containing protein [Candidatus Poribacteria bacterium]|nr:Ig-like domain-containing protein [Candidatus Poribacteria bacterium]
MSSKYIKKKIVICLMISLLFSLSCINKNNNDNNNLPITSIPTIISVSPQNNAANVPSGSPITVTFSEIMNASTINSNSFYLSGDVSGTITYYGKTATFTPSQPLAYDTQYTVTVTTKVKNKIGHAMNSNYIWKFTTFLTTPVVMSTRPINDAANVPINTIIAATFSKKLDTTTINTRTFHLNGDITGVITYNEKTVSFTPLNNLAINTQYTATITTEIKDLEGKTIAAEYTWKFTTGTRIDTLQPVVDLVYPRNNTANVPIETTISAVFSKEMNITTINSSTFFLSGGISGTISYDSLTAIFTPMNNLEYNTQYFATITTGAKDNAKNTIEKDCIWSFTTCIDDIIPFVRSANPNINTVNIPVDTVITATFSEIMDISTINSSTFTIVEEGLVPAQIEGTISYNGANATFTPLNKLAYNTRYTVTITTGAKDKAGNAIEHDSIWNFTTCPDTAPPDISSVNPNLNTINIPVNAVITAIFSEEINPSTINTSTFTIVDAGLAPVQIQGTVSFNGTIAAFTPSNNLAYNTQYTATITNAVKDVAGNKMTAAYTWNFTTIAELINLKAIAAGMNHTIGIKNDGTLWAWGDNSYGQLGDGTYINRNTPIQISTESDWNIIAAGGGHTITIKNNGTLWAWGDNSYGQLGDGTNNNRDTPIQIGTDNDWKSIAAGQNHTIAIKNNGTLWAWGDNSYGQLGDGTYINKNTPIQISTESDWNIIVAGGGHTVAIKNNGTLWAWGNNFYGQLGDGTNNKRNTPIQIDTDSDWKSIAAGLAHTIAIKNDSTLWAWGENSDGQLGDGTSGDDNNKSTPIQIGTDSDWKSITCGLYYTSGIKNNGSLWVWGNARYISSLIGSTINYNNFPTQIGLDTDWGFIAAGGAHTIAIKNDSTFWLWGLNDYGELGNGSTAEKSMPMQILIGYAWQNIAAGGAHTLCIKTDSTLWAWGYNEFGELGDGTTTHKKVPIQIGIDSDWRAIACGMYHSMSIKNNGTLWAWGDNYNGQVGDGTTTHKKVPTQIGIDSDWRTIACGMYHSMSIKNNGTLWAWGYNAYGQLGDTTNVDKKIPAQIGLANDWESIAAGKNHSLGIKNDGTLWAWGYNAYGQLGDGTNVNKNIPTQIDLANNWKSIAAGENHTLGIRSNGTLWAWGNNKYGQLGDGTTINKNIPAQIDLAGWKSIAAGKNHSIGVKSDGTLWAWGYNEFGQLGDGTTINKNTPIQINISNGWRSLSTSNDHSIGIENNGTLWIWGKNDFGQIGDGTTNSAVSPINIKQ